MSVPIESCRRSISFGRQLSNLRAVVDRLIYGANDDPQQFPGTGLPQSARWPCAFLDTSFVSCTSLDIFVSASWLFINRFWRFSPFFVQFSCKLETIYIFLKIGVAHPKIYE